MLSAFKETREQNTRPASHWPVLWRQIMRSSITKFAAAAVVIIAAILGLSYFEKTSSVAWADILNALSQVHNVVYNEKTILDPYEWTNKVYINEKGVMRTEAERESFIVLCDFNETSQMLNIIPSSKKVYVQKYFKKGTGDKFYSKFNWLDWIVTMHQRECKFAREEVMDGMKTYLYVNEIPYETTKVWIDPKTYLPVRMEEYRLPNAEKKTVMPQMSLSYGDFGGDPNISNSSGIGSGRGSGLGIQKKETKIRTDFVWNGELDESLFSMEIPQGYEVEEKTQEHSETTKEDLLDALEFYAEMNGKIFPSNIDMLGDPNVIEPLLVQKYHKGGVPKDEFDQALGMMNKILRGVFFVQLTKVNCIWGYASNEVSFGDANEPLFWWKPQDSNEYEVIYGDLSIRDENDMLQ
jgi:hypothetical protein